jgi:hypothetical protein
MHPSVYLRTDERFALEGVREDATSIPATICSPGMQTSGKGDDATLPRVAILPYDQDLNPARDLSKIYGVLLCPKCTRLAIDCRAGRVPGRAA